MITSIESYSEWRKEQNLEAYSLNPFKALGTMLVTAVARNVFTNLARSQAAEVIRFSSNCSRTARSRVKDQEWIKKHEADFELIDELQKEFTQDPKLSKSQVKKCLSFSKSCIMKLRQVDEQSAKKLCDDYIAFMKKLGIEVTDLDKSLDRAIK